MCMFRYDPIERYIILKKKYFKMLDIFKAMEIRKI